MYKLVAIDLDGTMLNTKGIVTQKTKEAIKKAIEKGTEIIIASGRNINSIRTIASEIGLKKYCISGNGAAIYDLQNDQIIYKKYMLKNEVLKAIKVCEENNIYYTLYTDECIFAKQINYNTLAYYSRNIKLPENKRTPIVLVNDIYEFVEENEEENFIKIMICEEDEQKLLKAIESLKEIGNVTILETSYTIKKIELKDGIERNMEYYYSEILNQDSDKWNAIEFLMNELNVKKEEVVAIGDNTNDFKMLENAGLGISLEGSHPKAIEKADEIVQCNDADGVAEAIEKYVI